MLRSRKKKCTAFDETENSPAAHRSVVQAASLDRISDMDVQLCRNWAKPIRRVHIIKINNYNKAKWNCRMNEFCLMHFEDA